MPQDPWDNRAGRGFTCVFFKRVCRRNLVYLSMHKFNRHTHAHTQIEANLKCRSKVIARVIVCVGACVCVCACVCVFARVCIMIQAGGKVKCRAEVVKVGESGAGQGALRGQRCAVFMFLLYYVNCCLYKTACTMKNSYACVCLCVYVYNYN